MARCGHANFLIEATPCLQDEFWRECLGREHWQHYYHPLNTRIERPSYKSLTTTSVDFFTRPWLILNRLNTSPAGKQRFHRAEPSARLFEPRIPHNHRLNSSLPRSSRRARSSRSLRSSMSSSTRCSSNFSARLLAKNASQPDIPSFHRIINK